MSAYFNALFGANLRAARKRAGLSLRQLSARAGLARSQLRRIDRGEAGCLLETALDLADALGCDLAALTEPLREEVIR